LNVSENDPLKQPFAPVFLLRFTVAGNNIGRQNKNFDLTIIYYGFIPT